jgi:broad specificity phosphatase PhoE
MTTFYLIRHAEPRYDEVIERGIYGMAFNFGKLTDNGILQAHERGKDPLLKDAQIIVASPFTRALQTAAIIASHLGIEVVVEHDLHEWMPDINPNKEVDGEGAFEAYMKSKGAKDSKNVFQYETFDAIKKRMELVLLKYTQYDQVIVVSHGIAISTLTHFDDVIEHCGVRQITL